MGEAGKAHSAAPELRVKRSGRQIYESLRERAKMGARASTLLCIAAVAAAAQAPGAQPPEALLRELGLYGGLDAKQLATLARGRPVVKSLDAPDKTEVALLGVIALEIPRQAYVEGTRDVRAFLAAPTRSALGFFGAPATPSDAESLVLDHSAVSALEKCRPFSCDVKLPAAMMERFRDSVHWRASPDSQVSVMFRRWMADYVNAYRARGAAAMVVYDDTKRSIRSSDANRVLVSESPALAHDAPALIPFLTGDAAAPSGVRDTIYWAVDARAGLKPILSIAQLAVDTAAADTSVALVISRQLYADHYFEAFLDVTIVVDGDASPTSPRAYLIVERRAKFDDLPSGGLFSIRGRAVHKLRDALRDELARTRAGLRPPSPAP
jgi:hypothetical protein